MAEPQNQQISLEDAIAYYNLETDPFRFVYFAYPWGEEGTELENAEGPDKWQAEVLEELGEQYRAGKNAIKIAIKSGHGVGKSTLLTWIQQWFMTTKAYGRGVVTANTKPQLDSKTWAEMGVWHNRLVTKPWFRKTATRYYHKDYFDTWFISPIAWTKEKSEAFAGTHAKHVLMIFDEASKIDDEIWDVAEGAMTTPGSIWIVAGNPTRNVGRFKDCFDAYAHRWTTFTVDTRESKVADLRWANEIIEDRGEDDDYTRVRVKGEFPRASFFQLIPEDIVKEAMGKHLHENVYKYMEKVIGCDVARGGPSKTTITKRQGKAVLGIQTMDVEDTNLIAETIMQMDKEFKSDAIFVDATGGYGGGVVDNLHRLGCKNAEGIIFGAQAGDTKQYYNKRSEMWDLTKKWLQNGGAIPDDKDLKEELIAAEYGFSNKDQLQLERKEDMMEKLRNGRSPDKADSLVLTFARPVIPKNRSKNLGRGVTQWSPFKRTADWDPLFRN